MKICIAISALLLRMHLSGANERKFTGSHVVCEDANQPRLLDRGCICMSCAARCAQLAFIQGSVHDVTDLASLAFLLL